MKSYHIFKIYKRFYKEREKTLKKTLVQQSMRKENLRKLGLCFRTGYFMKPFSSIGLFVHKIYFISQAHTLPNFGF